MRQVIVQPEILCRHEWTWLSGHSFRLSGLGRCRRCFVARGFSGRAIATGMA